jgi:hypothetical protein
MVSESVAPLGGFVIAASGVAYFVLWPGYKWLSGPSKSAIPVVERALECKIKDKDNKEQAYMRVELQDGRIGYLVKRDGAYTNIPDVKADEHKAVDAKWSDIEQAIDAAVESK